MAKLRETPAAKSDNASRDDKADAWSDKHPSGLPDANTIISFRLVTIHFVATAGSFAHCSAFVFR